MAQQVSSPGARVLIMRAIPALAIGAGCAVVLWVLDELSGLLSHLLWTDLPEAFGASGPAPWWIFTVLALTGVAVGAVVWLVPGHGGLDSAVTELDGPFPRLHALPSLALVVILSLAGGVSLGPENPIIAINATLTMVLLGRMSSATSGVKPKQLAMLAVAGTIGALFGTPVAAALLFTGAVGAIKGGGSLWDKLFLPVAAGGAGAVVTLLLGGPMLSFRLPAMGTFQPIYLLTGFIVAACSALIGIAAAWLFPRVHRAFHALRNPLVFVTLGGVLLGVLGVIGGPITMFKGLEQTGELLNGRAHWSVGELAAFAGIKLVALLIAASAGFRGGRIFPIVFVGAALGLLGSAVLPDTPVALGVACAVMGVVLAEARDGWIAIFIGIALVGDIHVLPLLCIIVLPVWLIVTSAPPFVVKAPNLAGTPVPAPDASV